MKNLIKVSVAFIALAGAAQAGAGVAVIANPSLAAESLTAEQVGQIFLGRAKSLPGGTAVTPIDLAEGVPVRAQFAERVLGKTEQQVRSYWSRMIFTGKGQPPRSVATPEDMVRAVAATPGAIGYIDSKAVTPKMKVLYRVD